jgi:SagB-type dehydrogenase family enzyme
MRGPTKQIKRSECLIFFFQNGKFHCKNYLTGVEVESSALLIPILQALEDWRTPEEVEQLLRTYSKSSVRRGLRQMLAHGLIVERGSAQAVSERTLNGWKVWGVEARAFHFATKHAFRRVPDRDQVSANRVLLRESPQPALIKRYPGVRHVSLPDPRRGLRSEFPRVLLARRTERRFAPGGISVQQLSAMLWLTWGVTGRIRFPWLGRLLLKTSPSGGARHPVEVYVFALRVRGLPRGVYHYRGDVHRLELLGRRVWPGRVVDLCAGQSWVGDCSAVFVMTAVFPRVMWRYRFSRAYRVVLLEAGHFCQTFCLVATWLGLAPFSTAALVDEKIEKTLGLDGARESVLYAAGVGPKKEGDVRTRAG